MSIKFGSKPVEFEKGKAGIVVGSRERLPTVIDTLIAAVRAGELDGEYQSGREAAEGRLISSRVGSIGSRPDGALRAYFTRRGGGLSAPLAVSVHVLNRVISL
jgi:hypothetical protein